MRSAGRSSVIFLCRFHAALLCFCTVPTAPTVPHPRSRSCTAWRSCQFRAYLSPFRYPLLPPMALEPSPDRRQVDAALCSNADSAESLALLLVAEQNQSRSPRFVPLYGTEIRNAEGKVADSPTWRQRPECSLQARLVRPSVATTQLVAQLLKMLPSHDYQKVLLARRLTLAIIFASEPSREGAECQRVSPAPSSYGPVAWICRKKRRGRAAADWLV
ncbi:hypothetical protein K402DRAFT_232017 [Aulographum hederae CBS 113979]|uniref:Uncharacterized protein n=1 Tax=Aulographum hederae CBS 113979 TaxID=1176131 RepID=A0A6G1GLJ5_9PEZI|nr:hypothetical protein K402DRAFT_232017 [Aulographum hederae CBS 113979]